MHSPSHKRFVAADSAKTRGRLPTRSLGERAAESVAYEGIGLLAIVPGYCLISGSTLIESATMLLSVSVVAMLWCGAFNTAFDYIDSHFARQVASDRPHRTRLLQSALCEAGEIAVTFPVIYALSGMGWQQALGADMGLAAVYVAYGYGFHLAFDKLRPVGRRGTVLARRHGGMRRPSPLLNWPQQPGTMVSTLASLTGTRR